MSISGIQPRQSVEQDYQDYLDKDQGRVQMKYEDDMYVELYPTIEQKIRVDALLSR